MSEPFERTDDGVPICPFCRRESDTEEFEAHMCWGAEPHPRIVSYEPPMPDPMSDPERKVTPMNVEHLFSDRATVNGVDLHVSKSGNRMVVRVDVDIQPGDPLFHEGVEYVVLGTQFHHGHDGVPAHLTLDVEGVRP